MRILFKKKKIYENKKKKSDDDNLHFVGHIFILFAFRLCLAKIAETDK
jgi:hypothetical protein